MAKTFQLEIITPTQIFSEGQVNYVRAESPDGQFGIMSHHTAATIALGIGELKVVKNGKEYYYATTGGFADIQSESVLLLLETAELVTDIDVNRLNLQERGLRIDSIIKKWIKFEHVLPLPRLKIV